MISKLFRLAATVALLAAIVWLTREHLLPTPHVSHETPPHYRSTPPPPEEEPDDLTAVKGIGPVYASKLNGMGLSTFRALAEIDAHTVAEGLGVSPDAVTDWIAQARLRIS